MTGRLCLEDGTKLKHSRRLNAEMHTIAFEYDLCEKCGRTYDKDGNEIIIKGIRYILKRDNIDPMM